MKTDTGHYEPIAREGLVFIIPPAVISFLLWWGDRPWWSFLFLVLAVCIALFFRNPERRSPQEPGIVVSPADGRVVAIEEGIQSQNLPGVSLTRISIFMSVFNVHVNRAPITGTVENIVYFPGGFLDARDPSASSVNERNSLILNGALGTIEVVQVAGKIARRIACWVNKGDEVTLGGRFGLIRFGSRLDVYLPRDFAVLAGPDDLVRAGVTVIARGTGLGSDEEQPPVG